MMSLVNYASSVQISITRLFSLKAGILYLVVCHCFLNGAMLRPLLTCIQINLLPNLLLLIEPW